MKLKEFNLDIIEHTFIDHYKFNRNDLLFDDGLPIIMTEKDAVKCIRFNTENCWYLPIECTISNSLELNILNKLESYNG
jgi:tetraacyldisaccharide 4'-kinase